jgi:hexosaminidase
VPGSGSLKYDKPFEVNRAMTVKAVMGVNKQLANAKPAEQSFSLNKATGKNVQYTNPNSRYYPGNGANSLTDGIRGTKVLGKQWHAFSGSDMIASHRFWCNDHCK